MKNLEKVQLDAFQRMSWVKARKTNLYIDKKPLEKGQVIRAHRQEIPVKHETIMVFADEEPLLNWAHPCRYLLYNANSGEIYDEVHARFPPYLNKPAETMTAFYEPIVPVVLDKWKLAKYYSWRDKIGGLLKAYTRGTRYAILFSGSSNYRHVNDLEFIYRTLIDVYGFSSSNISVLNYDGTTDYAQGWSDPAPGGNWPGDNSAYTLPVNAEATKSELEKVFDDLKGRLGKHDFLFIHTNNHGGHTGMYTGYPAGTESYLCTYSGPDYNASDFASKLSELPSFAQLMVMMEQCHSGGFNDPIIDNSPADETTVASACEEDRSSTGGNGIFDPFARDWIAGVTGVDPYGAALSFDPDSDNDGVVSASEAFTYADTIKDPYDTPVYSESPTGCGDDMHLGRQPAIFVLEKIKSYLDIIRIPPEEIWEKLPEIGPRPLYLYDEVVRRLGEIEKLIRPQ